MLAYLGRFAAVLGVVTGLVGAYLAAATLHLERVVLFAVLIAAAIASVPSIWRPLRSAIVAAIQYPVTAQRLAESEAELGETKEQVAELRAAVEGSYRKGIEFGQRQLHGVRLGLSIVKMPTLIAITGDPAQVKLVGRYEEGEDEEMPIGTWFDVVVVGTGDKRGVVEVLAVDAQSGTIEMACVERTVDAFWTALEHRVEADPSPPAAIELSHVSGFEMPGPRLLEGG